MRLQNVFKNRVFEASKLVSTKTLLLKHYYRRQGSRCIHQKSSVGINCVIHVPGRRPETYSVAGHRDRKCRRCLCAEVRHVLAGSMPFETLKHSKCRCLQQHCIRKTSFCELFPCHVTTIIISKLQKEPPEFVQPRLSSAKWHRSNTPKFVASHLGNTSHVGTNTPKFVPSLPRRKTNFRGSPPHSAVSGPRKLIFVLFFLAWVYMQQIPNPPKFAQPGLSRLKGRSSQAKGYTFRCVCSRMAGRYPRMRAQVWVCLKCDISTYCKFAPAAQHSNFICPRKCDLGTPRTLSREMPENSHKFRVSY